MAAKNCISDVVCNHFLEHEKTRFPIQEPKHVPEDILGFAQSVPEDILDWFELRRLLGLLDYLSQNDTSANDPNKS